MRNRSKMITAVALSAALLGLGGCASMQAALPDSLPKLACGVVGGVAMHALTGGASTAWRVAATVGGVGGGSYACDKFGK